MRIFSSIVWALGVGAFALQTSVSTAGVESLVQRLLPQHASSFRFALVDAPNADVTKDTYTVSSTNDGSILVQGNSVSALLSG
jgi:alpha-N-acetylglucosaminidase